MSQKADKVIFGKIHTVDRNQPKAEAAAVADTKVLRTMVGGEWV